MTIKTQGTCLGVLLALGLVGVAVAGTATSTLTLNVTVIDEPCVINGGNPIDIDFGNEMLTNKVDGSNYLKTVEYNLDCTNASNPALKLKISGTGADFDGTVLQASQTDLGIRLLSDGTPLALNSWLNFASDTPPLLQAVPVKSPGGNLTAGTFTAVATMTVDYQ